MNSVFGKTILLGGAAAGCAAVGACSDEAALHTWFLDADNEALFGAYYVYVTYLGE